MTVDVPLADRLPEEAVDLLKFARGSAVPVGFAWLDDDGRPTDRDMPLWITCRMTHSYALGELLGVPGSAHLVEHGLDTLLDGFRDPEHDGWFAAVRRGTEGTEGTDGVVPAEDAKEGYSHAFVVLAGSSAAAAGHERGRTLLEAALAVHERYFWDEAEGMVRESFDRAFTTPEAYRGANATMHTVEAYLAAADVLGEAGAVWRERAGRMATRVVDGWARERGWRIPEHFTERWEPLPEYNADEPAHPFRPYGATVGHALEWARLTLSAQAALGADRLPWAVEAAAGLFERAVADGWAVDGADGFVYTTDWDGQPMVRHRMHWVVAEAIGAAAALHRATGEDRYARDAARWWDYVEQHLRDAERGSWHHELDPQNRPASTTWAGKPDIYHALQATLVARLPLHPSFATALAQGRSHATSGH